MIVTGETCDDGNTAAGDGCSATCAIDVGFACTGTPSVCAATCGDGVIAAPAEACDDGNVTAGDGCSSTCAIEPRYSCAGAPSTCTSGCGDGIVAGSEQCDDGNTVRGDCCSATCQHEAMVGGLICETEPNDSTATANGPVTPTAAGVGFLASISPRTDADYFSFTLTAAADVGVETWEGTSNNFCSSNTFHDTYLYLIGPDGTTQLASDDDGGIGFCSRLTPATTAALRNLAAGTYFIYVKHYSEYQMIPQYNVRIAVVTCGDGVTSPGEACDDGNTTAGDGCSATCGVEDGYACHGSPSVCATPCGNGFVDTTFAEGCDDGNTTAGDGCSATCAVEVGFVCRGERSVCAVSCGNGVIDGMDTCDDGNAVSGDGCSSTCMVEPM